MVVGAGSSSNLLDSNLIYLSSVVILQAETLQILCNKEYVTQFSNH